MVEVDLAMIQRYQAAKRPGLTPEEEHACEELEAKLKMIKEGGTTGDPIDDFEMNHFLQSYLKGEHPFKDLMDGIEVGKLLLVVTNEAENMLHSGPGGPPPEYAIRTELALGVLEGEPQFVVTKAEVTFPMRQYVQQSRRTHDWEVQEGHIQLGWMEFLNLGNMAQPTWGDAVPCLQAYGGAAAIEYFRDTTSLEAKVRMKTFLDLGLVASLRLLSHPVPDDFQTQYDDKMYKGQVRILGELQALVLEEKGVLGREKRYDQDQHDFDWRQRNALQTMKSKIVKALKEGERYEMRTTTNTYDEIPGQTIKIGEFANGLWDKYVEPTEKQ